MTDPRSASARRTHCWPAPGGSYSYDTWGRNGRPVLLLHGLLFDRAMWWPAAAELRTDATVIAVDLPGHGTSPARATYDPHAVVTDLAHLLHDLHLTMAPVVVGHGTSAGLAALFAARFFTHAVVLVDAPTEPRHRSTGVDMGGYLDAMRTDELPASYRHLVTARADPALFAAYTACLPEVLRTEADTCLDGAPRAGPRARHHLAVYSREPCGGARYPVTVPAGVWRSTVYDVPGRFAHLADVHRFAADIRAAL
jgi:pimeloyl-ACP methyl ester carboxylesterase